jgi:hypothetical protein
MEEVKALQQILRSLLGTQGINVLGIYQLMQGSTVKQETPAIMVRSSSETGLVRRIKPQSGIECVIEPESDVVNTSQGFGIQSLELWTVTLDQHNPAKNLRLALHAIYQHPGIRPLKSPIVRPLVELANQKGEAPARAIVQIPRSSYLPNFF